MRAVLALVVILAAGSSQAALLGRAPLTPGGTDYQAYYDDVLDITWTADANLACTQGFQFATPGPCSIAYGGGRMSPTAAGAWIDSLNAQNGGLGYLGIDQWRLTTVTDIGVPGCEYYPYGGWVYPGTDCGYSVDVATGEMAHLYYSTLGNPAYRDTDGNPNPLCMTFPNSYVVVNCLVNVGPFQNLVGWAFWTGTPAPQPDSTWLFSFDAGLQFDACDCNEFNAWAVADGDALAIVPIPAAAWLFGGALAALGIARRRHSPCMDS